jgi:membrane protease YdiL (CAAX protease family)
MLRGTYSHINYFSKFVLLVVLVFSFLLFSVLFGILILVPFYGSEVFNLLASPDYADVSLVNALKVLQIINMTVGLLFPAFVYLWLSTSPTEPIAVFKKSVASAAVLLTTILIVVAQPLIGWASELNSYLALPQGFSFLEDWMKSTEKQGELITEAFLSTTTTGGLLVNIFMITILPAFAEELLFRGALAGLFKSWTKSTHMAVIFSAFIFAAIHLQFYGFLPRFLLGVALGYLYFWSGSLWLSIAAHFTNNFLSVIVEFLFRKGYSHTNAENFGIYNATWLTIISIIGVAGILYFIRKLSLAKNKQHRINTDS